MFDTSSPQFQDAIKCARTQWLKQLLDEFLPQLIPLTNSARDRSKAKLFDALIKDKFVERGLTSPSQQKNRITDVRNAIKVFDPQHPVLSVVGLSSDEWIAINSQAASHTHHRSTQFLAHPDEITQTALDLLQSHTWSDIAAGLAVITGRRVSEVLQTASFELVSQFSVMFVGAAKRRHESVPLEFEIPTLVEAPFVLDAISRLRSLLDTQDLTNRQINDKYEPIVARTCDRHFRDLVPTRDGKNNLYSHLFRAVYATIATHWFCPTSVSDLEFRAYIQGHFKILDEKNPTKQTDMASSRHYWDYKISDGHGNVDGRLGIRLDEDGVEILKAFAPQPQKTSSSKNLGRIVKITVTQRDRSALAHIQERFGLQTRANANHYVLNLAQSLIDNADRLNLSPEALLERLDSFEESSSSVSASEATTDMEENQEPVFATEDREPVTESESKVSHTQILFEKMDQQLNQMSQQQQSLDHLTHAIGELVHVFDHSLSSISPPKVPPQPANSSPLSKSTLVQSSKPTQKTQKTPPKPQSEVSPRKSHSMQVRQKVNQYIDAIMAFNDTLDRPHGEKWSISVAGLKRLAGCGQHPVYAVYNARKSEIDAHHQKHQLSSTHNKKDKSFPPIESVISL
ncbi:protelomerase family protein [Pleurocapsa sp. PCC 7319]|uniref:protelomerase family protein n=1 Tax=Pleurocapsa sp. PCC 7319 TaxID=118161 RepID=UPI00034655E2|nr:protelomerase family protein [Pleurocapsa sp. PCC 7319]